ncbi:MAG: hypothetical protein WAU41_07385, partial [Gaiellaceae bacterium]
MRVAVIGSPVNESTVGIVSAWRALGIDASLVVGAEVRSDIGPEDIALVRLDVLPTLDGIEPGLLQVLLLERRGT